LKNEIPSDNEVDDNDDKEDSIDWEEYFQEEASSEPLRGQREQREAVEYENFVHQCRPFRNT